MIDNENEQLQEQAWDAELKNKERLFVLHYCTDEECFLNATAAYRATYTHKDRKSGQIVVPEQTTCEANGSRLMKRDKVKNAIKKLLVISQDDLDTFNTHKILSDLALLATYNPSDILTDVGTLKCRLSDMGEKAKCIAQIQPTPYGVRYTLYDRTKAIDKLTNYLNIVRPEQQTEVILPVMEIPAKAESAESWNKLSQED